MSDQDELLDPAWLVGLDGRPLEELRATRARCIEVETGLSYLRRLVHGSLDILQREVSRRAEGGGGVDLTRLVSELPEILTEPVRGPGSGRLPQTLEPVRIDPELGAAFEGLVNDGRITRVTELSAIELAELLEGLGALERRLSEQRRAFLDRIDAVQAEITRRYRDGEASVDELLRESG